MSTLNITPAERTSTDKYKEKCQKQKRHIQSLLSENQRLKEDLLKYQDEVRSLQNGLNGNTNYCGRNASNNQKKMEWDQSYHCNNKKIRDFCKNELFPNHKFLGQEQIKYMDDKQSLCSKIYSLVNISDTIRTVVDKKYYWNQKLVVMINNKMVELESNFNSFIKRQYPGM
jgi:hypothetical protein